MELGLTLDEDQDGFEDDLELKQITQRLSASVCSTYNAAKIKVINKIQRQPSPSIKGDQAIGTTLCATLETVTLAKPINA